MSESTDRVRKLRAKRKQEEETAAARARYIAEAVRGAELVAEELARSALSKPPATAAKDANVYLLPGVPVDGDRVERARRYAAWRWDNVAAGLAGESGQILSL